MRLTLNQCDHDEWDSFVAATPSSGFMQGTSWAAFKQQLGYGVHHLAAWDDAGLAGGLIGYSPPNASGPALLMAPHGPALDWSGPQRARGVMREMVGAVRELGWLGLRIEPWLEPPLPRLLREFRPAPVDVLPRETLWLDLSLPSAKLLAGMAAKCRYNIRLAGRRGVVVNADKSPAALNRLYDVMTEMSLRNGIFLEPVGFFAALLESLESAHLLFAQRDGETLGALFLVVHGGRATYLYGGVTNHQREAMAGYALQWAAIQLATELGCHTYDFYGFEPYGDPSHPYAGFSRFKRQFGGAAKRFVGPRDLYFPDRLASAVVDALRGEAMCLTA